MGLFMEEELRGHDGGSYLLCGLVWYMVVEFLVFTYLHDCLHFWWRYIFGCIVHFEDYMVHGVVHGTWYMVGYALHGCLHGFWYWTYIEHICVSGALAAPTDEAKPAETH